MDDTQRIRKVIHWLIYDDKAANETELAEILGYKKSSFSQLVNGKVPLSEKFVNKLCALDDNINKVWVLKGEGQMFKTANTTEDILRTSLAVRDRQVDELISLLKEQFRELKKDGVPRADVADSAAVG